MKQNLVYRLFERCAEKHPGKIAISDGRKDSSYASLNDQANYIARLLNAVGVGRGKIVGYVGNSGTSLVASLLGIFKTGGIYMPVDVALPAKRVRGMLEETGCRIVIVPGSIKKDFLQWQADWQLEIDYLLVVEEGQLESVELLKNENGVLQTIPVPVDKRKGNPNYDTSENDPAYIFYTSGSTGSGKPILGLQKGLVHFITWETGEFAIDERVRVSQLTKITFDASLRDIFLPLTNGGTLCIPSEETRSNTVKLLEWLEEIKVNIVHTVPSLFRLISKEIRSEKNTFSLPSLKHILMAGEPLYIKDITSWRESAAAHVELVNLYGTSETTMAKTVHRIGEVSGDPGQLIPAGKPIAGAFVAIVNNNGELCRIGEIGEIYIKTPYRTKGYYRHAELTATYFVQNPLNKEEEDIVHKTGDMGRYLSDRSIEVLGRSDDQVKINGTRIQLSEIEQSLLGCAGIDEAVVVVHKGANQENELVGYYTGNAVKETVYQYLATNLGESMVPGHLIQLPEFPLSANGKINKKELPRPDKQVVAADDYEPALPGVETELEVLWKELLGLTKIGRRVSFFEIGGNSLKAIQLISRIYKSYGVLVKINEIFASPTIEKLKLLIYEADFKQRFGEIQAIEEQEYYSLSFAQQRLWIISQLDKEQVAYNVAHSYLLDGELNIEALQYAFKTLINRHESLRTCYITIDGEPRQRILDAAAYPFRLNYVDLQQEPDSLAKTKELADAQATAIFDLENGPLLKVTITRLGESRYAFLLTVHHILFDAWSMEIMFNELGELYNAGCQKRRTALRPLKIQYRDYGSWLHRQLNSQRVNNSRQYWASLLAGDIPVIELPTDYHPAGKQTFNGHAKVFVIDPVLNAAIRNASAEMNVTLFMFFLTTVNMLMYRYTGQKDIIIGSPVAGRFHPDIEDQIGYFVNMIPFRTTFRPEATSEELFGLVKKNALDVYNHQMYPFVRFLDEAYPGNELNRENLFNVTAQFLNAGVSTTDSKTFDGITVSSYLPNSYASKFDLTFTFGENEEDGELFLGIEYRTDLFKESTICGMQQDLFKIIELVTKNNNVTLWELKKHFNQANSQQQFARFSEMMSAAISTDY